MLERTASGLYSFDRPISRTELFRVAEEAIAEQFRRGEKLCTADAAKAYFQLMLAAEPAEVFVVAFLDTRHAIIACERMFNGTIDGASVHPREVLRRCIAHNAAAVLLAHNHPSGTPEPSASDTAITRRLQEVLALIDVRVIDHLVVGRTVESMAARGLL